MYNASLGCARPGLPTVVCRAVWYQPSTCIRPIHSILANALPHQIIVIAPIQHRVDSSAGIASKEPLAPSRSGPEEAVGSKGQQLFAWAARAFAEEPDSVSLHHILHGPESPVQWHVGGVCE